VENNSLACKPVAVLFVASRRTRCYTHHNIFPAHPPTGCRFSYLRPNCGDQIRMAPQKRRRLEDNEEVIRVESASSSLRHAGVSILMTIITCIPLRLTYALSNVRKHGFLLTRRLLNLEMVGVVAHPLHPMKARMK
jgi:hypothetical protein